MTKVFCDVCKEEKKVKKYFIPYPTEGEVYDKHGTVLTVISGLDIGPKEVEMCDKCARQFMERYSEK